MRTGASLHVQGLAAQGNDYRVEDKEVLNWGHPSLAMTFHPRWPGELAVVDASGRIGTWEGS